ncbi:MAG: hypothetical protein Q9M22_04250 [Mariprofundaceae bacterium]|nr:hypothetical protein [Mariprofundaceae bacterium]
MTRLIFLLIPFVLASCAQMHPVLQTTLNKTLHHIDIAALEFDDKLKIRRLTPLTMMLGSTGLMIDNIMVEAQGYEYAKKVGDVGLECGKVFKSTLIHRLKESGYVVHDRNERYWDYFKASRKSIRDQTDAILRINMEQVGFWAGGLTRPYRASALIRVEMVAAQGREVLYRNRFVIGLSPKDVRILKDYIGTTELVERGKLSPTFKNFKTLLANGSESRFDLLNVMALAARKIATDLKPKEERDLLAVEYTSPNTTPRGDWNHGGLNPSGSSNASTLDLSGS